MISSEWGICCYASYNRVHWQGQLTYIAILTEPGLKTGYAVTDLAVKSKWRELIDRYRRRTRYCSSNIYTIQSTQQALHARTLPQRRPWFSCRSVRYDGEARGEVRPRLASCRQCLCSIHFVSRGPFFGVLYRLARSRTRALHSQARSAKVKVQ